MQWEMSHKGRSQQKKTGFFGNFSQRGGGVFSNPKTFVNLPSVFLYAKIILRCQNMFYNSGEVISDQFNHITPDSDLIINIKKNIKLLKVRLQYV